MRSFVSSTSVNGGYQLTNRVSPHVPCWISKQPVPCTHQAPTALELWPMTAHGIGMASGMDAVRHAAPACPHRTQRNTVLCCGTPGLKNLRIDQDLDEPLPGFDSIDSALDDLSAGKFVVVLDDEDRENEGDLIIAADKVTTQAMHFMVEHTSGVVCMAMDGRDLDRLKLPLMVKSEENEESMYTAFTVSVDIREGITTGISAADRAKTIRRLADPTATATNFRRPGHIFPLRYHPGGVLVRPGHTEASVDLARLAGCSPAGVLCEIVNREDGSMARTLQLRAFARTHNLRCITIADLIRYRLKHDKLVLRTASATVQSAAYGKITIHTYRCALDESEHLAVVFADTAAARRGAEDAAVPVHVRRDSCVSDVLVEVQGPAHAAGAPVDAETGGLHGVMAYMASQGNGVVVYMRPRFDGRPSLAAQVRALGNADSAESAARRQSRTHLDLRVYGLASQILRDLNVRDVAVVGAGAESTATALTSCGLDAQVQTVKAQARVDEATSALYNVSNGASAIRLSGCV